MKKIFYSLMAVALCACAQSDVEDAVTPPQPENNGLKFTVVDNGFTGEDGTRVTYGDYGTDAAYHATFEEGDEIGVYAIKSADMANDGTPNAYVVENAKLTLTNGIWKGSIDFKDADLLFAYAPYRADVNLGEGKPLFTGAQGSWAVSTGNNRFFVWDYENQDNGTKEKFEAADWMGAAANVTSDTKEVTFNMIHMRGMVELTTDKDVELTDLTLAIGSDNGAQYHFKPYFVNEGDANRTKNVYRILTTEYRSTNTVYATIKDLNIEKKYKKTLSGNGAGKCFCVNIAYTPAETITVGAGESLAAILTEKYGADYATNGKVTSLRLAGELQGCTENANGSITFAEDSDWATLRSLTTLTTLDMYQLTNTSIPDKWIWRDEGATKTKLCETLTTLILPNSNLKTIGWNALQPNSQLTKIELPASVTKLKNGVFWGTSSLSVRIPEDSKLETIGDGAFQYVNVYTDPNNVTVLKLPASVTQIDNNAFANISTMGKIIFQSTEAPTINGTNVFGSNNTMIYVPNTDNYKNKGLFTGKRVVIGPILTADDYYSPYTINYDGIGLPALCDGITGVSGKHWHSNYGKVTYDQWGIYIDITLPKQYNNLKFFYTTRKDNDNAAPKTIRMAVSNDGENYTAVGNDYEIDNGNKQGNQTKEFGAITADSPYKYVRFAVLVSEKGTASGTVTDVCTNLAELTLCEETWTE